MELPEYVQELGLHILQKNPALQIFIWPKYKLRTRKKRDSVMLGQAVT